MYSLEISGTKSGSFNYRVLNGANVISEGFRATEHEATNAGREDMRLCRLFFVGQA